MEKCLERNQLKVSFLIVSFPRPRTLREAIVMTLSSVLKASDKKLHCTVLHCTALLLKCDSVIVVGWQFAYCLD